MGSAFVLDEGAVGAIVSADPAGVGFGIEEIKVGDEDGKGWDVGDFRTDGVT